MQVAVMLIGCLLGFAGGALAFFALGLGVFMSLAIWAVSGPLSIVLLASLHTLRQPRTITQSRQQTKTA